MYNKVNEQIIKRYMCWVQNHKKKKIKTEIYLGQTTGGGVIMK